MLAALAGVWLFIFVPSWMKSSASREQQRSHAAELKSQRLVAKKKTLDGMGARQALSVRRSYVAKRLSGLIALASLATLLVAVVSFGVIAQPWMYVAASAGTFVISFAANRIAHSLQLKALSAATQIRRPVRLETAIQRTAAFAAGSPEASELVQKDPRAWNAPGVPSQILRSPDGTLETPTIADVVNLAASMERRESQNGEVSVETASINLDEILKRRRANG